MGNDVIEWTKGKNSEYNVANFVRVVHFFKFLIAKKEMALAIPFGLYYVRIFQALSLRNVYTYKLSRDLVRESITF